MNRIAVAELTSEAFAPFGEIGAPYFDGGQAPPDAALDMSRGTLRFYSLVFEVMARHDRLTRCLSAGDGEPWLTAVVPASIVQLGPIDISAFRVLSARFIELGLGTWHVGPYFVGPLHDFYNRETVDTGIVDYTVR
jgi:ureidoglycolate hydrolase